MIAISENLIRSIRRSTIDHDISFDASKDCVVENLLSSSPTDSHTQKFFPFEKENVQPAMINHQQNRTHHPSVRGQNIIPSKVASSSDDDAELSDDEKIMKTSKHNAPTTTTTTNTNRDTNKIVPNNVDPSETSQTDQSSTSLDEKKTENDSNQQPVTKTIKFSTSIRTTIEPIAEEVVTTGGGKSGIGAALGSVRRVNIIEPRLSIQNDLFTKEPVMPRGGMMASSLSKELLDNGMLRSAGRAFNGGSISVAPMIHRIPSALSAQLHHAPQQPASASGISIADRVLGTGMGATLILKVFYAIDIPPIKVTIRGACPVSKIIDHVLAVHSHLKLLPALAYPEQSDRYEFRMLDDDDGTPDEDIAPLDPKRDFNELGLDGVALVEKVESDEEMTPLPNVGRASDAPARVVRQGRTMSMEINMRPTLDTATKFFLKVHVADHESHVLPVNTAMTLDDLLPIITKKRMSNTPMPPEQYKFHYIDQSDELDMKTRLSDIQADELRLIPKIQQKEELSFNREISQSIYSEPSPSQFSFSVETAGQYSEYKVIKTNQRGKRQHRILGVDKNKIYNKSTPSNGNQKRRISFDTVTRAHRPILSVHSVSIVPTRPTCFQILFKEKSKIVSREYETETKMEAAEIVAKIRFLVNNASLIS